MRAFRVAVGLMAMLTGILAAMPAVAHGYYGGRGFYGGHGFYGARGYWYGPRVGVYVSRPLWWGVPYAYPLAYGNAAPYVYAPPPAVIAPSPPVYIERGDQVQSTAPPAATAPTPTSTPAPTAAAPGTQWWYLCASPRGAYPYVRECPGGWERVPAVPAGTVLPPEPQ